MSKNYCFLFLHKNGSIFFPFLLLLFTSCNIFDTRPTQPPNQTRTHFTTPTNDSIVIANLQYAIEERSTENYVKCFSDSAHDGRGFQFIPSQSALNQHPGTFEDWNLNAEKNYFDKLRTSTTANTPSALLLEYVNPPHITGDSVFVSAKYTLSFMHNKNFPHEARGALEFAIGLNHTSGTWSIYRWSDYQNQNDTALTWSDWKALFNQ